MHNHQKGQKLTLLLESWKKDMFGVWELRIHINSSCYTYLLPSEFILRKVCYLSTINPTKALKLLKENAIEYQRLQS